MQSIDNLKKDIEFINEFTNNFYNKTNELNTRANNTIKKLENIIAVEKLNEAFLANLEMSLSDEELNNVVKNLQICESVISEKQKEYLTFLEKNSKKITELSNLIRDKRQTIDSVNGLAQKIDSNLVLLDGKTPDVSLNK